MWPACWLSFSWADAGRLSAWVSPAVGRSVGLEALGFTQHQALSGWLVVLAGQAKRLSSRFFRGPTMFLAAVVDRGSLITRNKR